MRSPFHSQTVEKKCGGRDHIVRGLSQDEEARDDGGMGEGRAAGSSVGGRLARRWVHSYAGENRPLVRSATHNVFS